jgi:DNA-binding transcriptional ArsR family regulator
MTRLRLFGIFSVKTPKLFWEEHPDAESSLRAWYTEAKKARWKGPQPSKPRIERLVREGCSTVKSWGLLLRICAIEQTWVNERDAMEERVYRQSSLCRLLGNPLAFAVVNVLGESKELSPSEIARAVGRSVSRVSHVLAALRLAEVVRYETDGRQTRYRLKHPRETHQLLQALEKFIDSSSAFQ